ncbi:MAG: flagellar hook-basal body complex protein [Chthoniobacteraceae bacterium]|nr:flagellar hook-basal body complex protein [Chthoniobacteraceae bacterium]
MALGSLDAGVSALTSFEKGLEVIGNNVANVNTTGYKGSTAEYGDSFSTMLRNSSPASSDGNTSNSAAMQVGTGVKLDAITTNFQQGTLSPAGSESDLGISGNGFFVVRDPASGNLFVTRAGNFRVDDNGYLVTQDGMRVQGLSDGSASYEATNPGGVLTYAQTATAPKSVGDVKIDYNIGPVVDNTSPSVPVSAPTMNSYSIDQSGNINISLSNGDTYVRGKVLLQSFRDPGSLVREGGNLYSNLDAAGPQGGNTLSDENNAAGTNGLGKIQSKALELSNVDLSSEFANMISTQRAFQAGSRIITVTDSVLEEIINLKRS